MKDDSKAVADYNEVIRLEPNDVWAYRNRASYWMERNQDDKALLDFTRALSLAPNDHELYLVRGSVLARNKRWDEAIADYTQSLLARQRRSRTSPSRHRMVCKGKLGQRHYRS